MKAMTAEEIMASVEAAAQRRAEAMPTEHDAIRAMHDAWVRLKELGWRDGRNGASHREGYVMSGFTDQDGFRVDDEEHERPRREPRGCACFAPGEASGTCPGQDRCPMCQDDEDASE